MDKLWCYFDQNWKSDHNWSKSVSEQFEICVLQPSLLYLTA